MRAPNELSDRFRSQGLKITPQRELIFRLLQGNTTHPTADALYLEARRTMPMISLKTVYQALHDLQGLGEIHVLDLGTGSSRFDPNVGQHHHLVCTTCGNVHDIDVEFPGVVLPDKHRHGFSVYGADVVFRGICASCQVVDGAAVAR